MIPIALIMKQPDLGTALVFIGVLISMLWMGNIRLLYMILFLSTMIITISNVYFMLIYRMVQIAMENKDLAGSYIIIGIIGMLVFQIFVNIGMLIGLVPRTGISLPFISYGGSSLFSNMIAIGLVLSVRAHHDETV